MKKRNLIFHALLDNVPLIKYYLNLETDIEEYYRLGKNDIQNTNSSYCRLVLVGFTAVNTRNIIIKSRSKLRGSKILMNVDLTTKERQ